MTPAQKAALQGVAGRELTQQESETIDAWLGDRRDDLIAQCLSAGRIKLTATMVTERGVRALPVAPRSRYALLNCLREAQSAAPSWLNQALTNLGVAQEDHAAYADDLASAWRWITTSDGIDVGSIAARQMLDLIAANLPAAAPASIAAKALAEQPDPISTGAVSAALNGV